MNILRIQLLTVFGLGRLPLASGTFGSLPPVAFALLLVWLLWPQMLAVNIAIALVGAIFAIVCVRFGHEAEQRFGRKDPSAVVADEVAGQAIALLFLPWRAPVDRESWTWNAALAATAFVTFRFFDIVKIPPARNMQRLSAGWGILVDDLIAGIYALLLSQLVARLALPGMLP